MGAEVEKTFKIQQPTYKRSGPDHQKALEDAMAILLDEKKAPALLEVTSKANAEYLSWDEFRNKSWVTDQKEVAWVLIASNRRMHRNFTPIRDKDKSFYSFSPLMQNQLLHEIDMEMGGNMFGISDFSETDKRHFVRSNLIEEAISSSKLEGANTSREVAKKMLREGRKPRDKGETMIFNNHAAMTLIEEKLKKEPMSLAMLLDLHKTVTRGTLDDESQEGRLRETFDKKGNRLKVMPWDEVTVAYVTPDREFVEQELPSFVKFANDVENLNFIHPVMKAIMLHFWLGLLHPFEDGNGRLARIVFYWYMLKKGYWAFSYLSLSERIIKSPKQYAMAYINAEQDGYDLNYFLQYNLEKITLARDKLRQHLVEKRKENREKTRIIKSGGLLNERQIKLAQYLARDELRHTSPSEYHNTNSHVSYVTASTDLKNMLELGYLKKQRVGRYVTYFPTAKLLALLD